MLQIRKGRDLRSRASLSPEDLKLGLPVPPFSLPLVAEAPEHVSQQP